MSVRSVASVYTRSAPREPDLGNLDRRSCVLCSLLTVSSCPDGEIVDGSSLDRFCPSARWNNHDDDGKGKSKTEKTFDKRANERTFIADCRVFRCCRISSESWDFITIRVTKRQRVGTKSINQLLIKCMTMTRRISEILEHLNYFAFFESS